jgi:hypothetical protein
VLFLSTTAFDRMWFCQPGCVEHSTQQLARSPEYTKLSHTRPSGAARSRLALLCGIAYTQRRLHTFNKCINLADQPNALSVRVRISNGLLKNNARYYFIAVSSTRPIISINLYLSLLVRALRVHSSTPPHISPRHGLSLHVCVMCTPSATARPTAGMHMIYSCLF